MYAAKARHQPAGHQAMPAALVQGNERTMQRSSHPAGSRGTLQRSAADPGDHNKGVVVVTPMCTKTPPARVATSQATQPEDAQGHHASHRSTQPTNNHDSHSSLSQGTRLAPAPVGPNTGFIVVTPMCTRKPLACSKKGAESTGKDTAEIDVGALTATLKATQHQLKEMTDVAALLEGDLQKANAANKEAAMQKEDDNARALERQQALGARVNILERDLEHVKLCSSSEIEQAKRAAAALKQELSKVQKKAAMLPRIMAERDSLRTTLSAKEADLAIAHQRNTDIRQALQKEQDASARLKAFAASQVTKMDVLRREKVAAEEKAVVAATERENSERVAAQQLHIAHEQMTSKHQELMELTMATVAATQRAAWAKERASAAQEIACIAQTHKVAAIARARVAEEALAAAQTDKERLRTVACAALERMRLLEAQQDTDGEEIQTLRGQLMDLDAPEAAQFAPAQPHTAASSTWESDHPLLMMPESMPTRSIGALIYRVVKKTSVAALQACLPAWLARPCTA